MLGICSGLYHCSVIYPCQLMDISSMTLVFSVMVSQNLNLDYYDTGFLMLIYQFILYLFIRYDLPCQYNSVMNIFSVLYTTNEYNSSSILTIILLLIGLFNSYIDLTYKYKYGHTLWHFFTAAALYMWNQPPINIEQLQLNYIY